MKIVAIISIRNNVEYLKILLEYLEQNRIHVILIDQESDDGSEKVYNSYMNMPVMDVVKTPFNGSFSLQKQLELKEQIRQSIKADWIIHHDSDEIMQSAVLHESLYDMIVKVDKEGYNIINFEEYVFIPEDHKVDYSQRNFIKEMKFYYCFAPAPLRLNRIFRNNSANNSLANGGHQIIGEEGLIYPRNMILRHYIGLSFSKLISKYKNRIFSSEEIEKGWHFNRLNIDWDKISIPDLDMLNFIPFDGINNSNAYKKHFWNWEKEEMEDPLGNI